MTDLRPYQETAVVGAFVPRCPGHTCPDRSEMTRYPQDRASVLATTLISIVVRHLRAPEVHAEIAQTLREEFPRHCAPSARRDPPQR